MKHEERKELIPVDIDWTMDMSDDIARYILEMQEKDSIGIDGMLAPIMGVHIIAIVAKHMKKNGYCLYHNDHNN